MARVTVQDCTTKIPDRFELAALAAQGAKYINSRAEINPNASKEKHDKPTVIALRQIASGTVSAAHLRHDLLNRLRTKSRVEPISNDDEVTDVVENFDYLPGGPHMYVGEDYSDLDNQIFIDDTSED